MTLTERPILSVSEFTREIKQLLERSFHSVSIRGEISNFHRHSSGHLYFTLKDASAQLAAVMFRGSAAALFFQPQNGMEVICTGDITVYEPRGNYQILISTMLPRGEGSLQVAFEKLKRKLEAEGLFDARFKKPLPAFPRRVALVTSPTGAAVRDMISVMRRRNPSVELVLVPVQVQGAGAAEQITAALDDCNLFGAFDVIITGRGGGSIEDLWAFNEEIVARAIHRSVTPIVSAVGHEVDFTIADFVADVRAATPSVAAELVVPSIEDLKTALTMASTRMQKFVNSMFDRARRDVVSIGTHWVFRKPEQAVQRMVQQLDDAFDQIHRSVALRQERESARLDMHRAQLTAHDPARILSKGFTMVRREGEIVEDGAHLAHGEALTIVFRDGDVETLVQ